jgi:hypothetical protein
MPAGETNPAAGMEFVAQTPASRGLGHFLKGRSDGSDVSVSLFPPPLFNGVLVDRIQLVNGEFR